MKDNALKLRISISHNNMGLGYIVMLKIVEESEDSKRIVHMSKEIFETGSHDTALSVLKDIQKSWIELFNGMPTSSIGKTSFTFDIIGKMSDMEKFKAEFEKITTITGIDSKPYSPLIIKLLEKHGDRYFVATTPTEAGLIYHKILSDRFNEKMYDWMKDHEPSHKLEKPKFTVDQVNALPDEMDSQKKQMLSEIKKYDESIQDVKNIKKTYGIIKEAVETKNYIECKRILIFTEEVIETIHPDEF